MVTIKHEKIYVHRLEVRRNVEDWRNDPSPNRGGPWAVHCLQHNTRHFFTAYSQAKSSAEAPDTCSACQAFDRRCIFCPSDINAWTLDPTKGFTPSVGHITGRAVCLHHQYGDIPDGIDYLQAQNVVLGKPVVEVFIGSAFTGLKVFTVSFQSGDQTFWIRSELDSQYMSYKGALEYKEALAFGLIVAACLNTALTATAAQTPLGFEPWEEVRARCDQAAAVNPQRTE
jgi:hypothetical protein